MSKVYCFDAANKRGVQTMRLHVEKHGHDPRQVDLVAVIALIVLVFGAIRLFIGENLPAGPLERSCLKNALRRARS
jgi:hypothetical protein